MASERAPERRVVTLSRRERYWMPGYWSALVGCGVRMPAGLIGGRSMAGFLVHAEESDAETITLTFEGLEPE